MSAPKPVSQQPVLMKVETQYSEVPPGADAVALTEGWVFLANAKKPFHYIRDSKSLCLKWMYLGAEFDTDDGKLGGAPNRDDCAQCFKKRKAELEGAKA